MHISLSDRDSRKNAPGAAVASRVSGVVITLGIVSMLTDVSSESVAAILPLYVTGTIRLTTIAYGLIDGLYQEVSAFARIGGGWVSDRVDRPKWITFFGYGLSALAKVWLLFATGFAALAAMITVDRLGKGARTGPRDAIITASSRPENLGYSFGVHRMLDAIGATVGPLLAFLVLFFIPNGYSLVFVVSLAFAFVGVAILGLLVPGRRPVVGTSADSTRRQSFQWRRLNEPRLRRLVLAAGILGLLTVGDGFIYLSLQSRSHFAAQWFPLLYVGTNIAFFLFAVPLGRLADRIGRARVFVFGHVALLSALAVAIPAVFLLLRPLFPTARTA